jgi:hypothetical protein
LGGEEARRDEQGVAGEKETNEQTGFREDDRRESDVSSPLHQGLDVAESVEKIG